MILARIGARMPGERRPTFPVWGAGRSTTLQEAGTNSPGIRDHYRCPRARLFLISCQSKQNALSKTRACSSFSFPCWSGSPFFVYTICFSCQCLYSIEVSLFSVLLFVYTLQTSSILRLFAHLHGRLRWLHRGAKTINISWEGKGCTRASGGFSCVYLYTKAGSDKGVVKDEGEGL